MTLSPSPAASASPFENPSAYSSVPSSLTSSSSGLHASALSAFSPPSLATVPVRSRSAPLIVSPRYPPRASLVITRAVVDRDEDDELANDSSSSSSSEVVVAPPGFVVVSSTSTSASTSAANSRPTTPKRGRGQDEDAPRKRNSPYTAWTLDEDVALMECLQMRKLSGQKLGERAMQELELTAVPQLSQRSFKAIYNRYNKHLQWRSKRVPNSLAWLRDMHAGAPPTAKRRDSAPPPPSGSLLQRQDPLKTPPAAWRSEGAWEREALQDPWMP